MLYPAQTLGAEFLREGDKIVNLTAREITAALSINAFDLTSAVKDVVEDFELGGAGSLRGVFEFEGKSHIGFVRAKAVHRLGVAEVGEGIGQFDLIQTGKQGASKAFGDTHDVIFADEGHLDVDLGEFGLSIGAQILVAEALDDLEVAVVARDHQQLLVGLGRLRQGEKLAWMDPARDQIVAGALGGALGQKGGFYFDKVLFIKCVAHDLVGAMAQLQIGLDAGPAQIQIAVFEADLLTGVDIVFDEKRRRRRHIEYPQLVAIDLDFAGGQFGIDHAFGAGFDLALDGDDVFAAQLIGFLVRSEIVLGVEYDLGDAIAVAEVDKDHAAVVAPAPDPAHQ